MLTNRVSKKKGRNLVSVVIPVLNESATITSIVQYALRSPVVGEVIVVDDGSIDGTPELAIAAGARVITSKMLGKGGSMEDGMRIAQYETVLYLDGDLEGLCDDALELISAPILANEADFVKAKFTRKAGRVTILMAKPLIRTYFPELAHLEQPLSGIMAARKSLLQELIFENDYGVDVALLIDAAMCKARIEEVDIGFIEHRNQSLEALGEMATQVARSLLDRAARAGRLRPSFVREVKERERMQLSEMPRILERVPTAERLALFDMDGVLVKGRFIMQLAEACNRETDLAALLDNYTLSAGERMVRIAGVFRGVRKELFEEVARTMPLMPGAVETVIGLRKAGYRVGIVTDSYQVVSDIVRRRVFADFSFAHLMRFKNERASGRISLCPAMIHSEGCTIHDHCKMNVLRHLLERHQFARSSILAVGDGESDICMMQEAGCSIAFRPKNRSVADAAQFLVNEHSELLEVALAQSGFDRSDAISPDAEGDQVLSI